MDQAGQHGRAADDAGGHDLWVMSLEQLLNGVEDLEIDDRRDRNRHDFTDRLQFLDLGPLVDLVLAHIGAPGQDAVNLTDAPAPAITGEEAAAVQETMFLTPIWPVVPSPSRARR